MTSWEIPAFANESLGSDWEDHENKDNPMISYHTGIPFSDPS